MQRAVHATLPPHFNDACGFALLASRMHDESGNGPKVTKENAAGH